MRKFTAPWVVSISDVRCRFCHERISDAVFLNGQPQVDGTTLFNPDCFAHLKCLLVFQKGLRAAFGGEEA